MTQTPIIVCKYGGSSVTSEADAKHIRYITLDDSRRKIIVVSAPGKRFKEDEKITDMLINLSANPKNSVLFDKIMERYSAFRNTMINAADILKERLRMDLEGKEYRDAVVSFGEEACARVLADINGWEYVDPSEWCSMNPPFSAGTILPIAEERARKRFGNLDHIVVTPGFYGRTLDGKLITLDRNLSDLTGSYLAAAINASMYENFTDSAILAASPEMVDNPRKIEELVYAEAGDLTYSGFNILHDQAMLPVELAGVPIHVRSTKKYPEIGTLIKSSRELDPSRPIVGVAYKPGFYYTYVNRTGLDRMPALIHRLTGVFAEEGIDLLNDPGAINEISFLYHRDDVKSEKQLRRIEEKIYNTVGREGTTLTTRNRIGVIAVSGMGIMGRMGRISGEIEHALDEAGVEPETFCPGRRCILYCVNEFDGIKAVRAIYDRFLK